jgi:tRNA threonylcarbamoyladenosine biosynthesis protein TsaE
MQKIIQEYTISTVDDLQLCTFLLQKGDIIFFYGDLGSGKTTFIRSLLQKYIQDPHLIVRSPTYTYYSQYENIFHFDLYRLEGYDEFLSIGGEEILQKKDIISLIEWPELLEPYIQPTKNIHIKIQWDMSRLIRITEYTDDSAHT